jgi:Uma2 family endonuclease
MADDLAAPTTRGADGFARRAFTVDDVERMLAAGILGADEKFELIGGEIVPMSPEMRPHLVLKSRLGKWLAQSAPPGTEVLFDGAMRLKNAALLEPDLAVVKRQSLTHPGYTPIEDALLVVEIASAGLARDLAKAKAYAAAGVPELWIVDMQARETRVFRTLDGDWAEGAAAAFTQSLSPHAFAEARMRVEDFYE